MSPLSVPQVAELILALQLNPAVLLSDAPSLVVGLDSSGWTRYDWRRFKCQIELFTSTLLFRIRELKTESTVVVNVQPGRESFLSDVWAAMLQLQLTNQKEINKQLVVEKPRKKNLSHGRKATHEKFPEIIPLINEYIEPYACADNRRRKGVKTIDPEKTRNGKGFTLKALLNHLFGKVEGLYEHGLDVRTLHHLFHPPISNTREAARYKKLIDARKGTKRNNFRPVTAGTHYARSERKLIDEFMCSYGQLIISGDDMNIIQVGRPAVSRYHQIKGFFPLGQGPNFAVHDFPNSKYGIKLGGFMVRNNTTLKRDQYYTTDDL